MYIGIAEIVGLTTIALSMQPALFVEFKGMSLWRGLWCQFAGCFL